MIYICLFVLVLSRFQCRDSSVRCNNIKSVKRMYFFEITMVSGQFGSPGVVS